MIEIKKTMREAFLGLFLVFAFNAFGFSSATVLLKPLSLSFADLPAKYAVGVNSSGVCGALFVADPLDACSPLRNALPSNKSDLVRFALIIRGKCAFEEKALKAQNAGFKAAIVYDDRYNGDLVYMMINHDNVSVHSVFISKRAGEILKENARGEEDECCIFPLHNGTAWTVLAISFLSFIVIFSLFLIALFTPIHWLSSRGREHLSKRVDHKMVEALPCYTFSSAHSGSSPGETCAICLEDYKDGEVLKVLPCQHGIITVLVIIFIKSCTACLLGSSGHSTDQSKMDWIMQATKTLICMI